MLSDFFIYIRLIFACKTRRNNVYLPSAAFALLGNFTVLSIFVLKAFIAEL